MESRRTKQQRVRLLEGLMQSLQAGSKQELLMKLDAAIETIVNSPQKYSEEMAKTSGKSHADYIDWLKGVRREVARA